MDTGSADILSACGLEARVPIKPWLELSFPGSLQKRPSRDGLLFTASLFIVHALRLCNRSRIKIDRSLRQQSTVDR